MLQPMPIDRWPHRDRARELTLHLDHPRVRRFETIPEPLPHPLLVKSTEPLQIRPQDDCTQLGDRLDVGRSRRAQEPSVQGQRRGGSHLRIMTHDVS